VRGGIEKVTFQKVSYISPFGTEFKPKVSSYNLRTFVGAKLISQKERRLILAPDVIFAAADLGPDDPAAVPGPIFSFLRTRDPYLISPLTPVSGEPVTDVGPGARNPQTTITFNKLGPYLINTTPFFLEDESRQGFIFGSIDGTTNKPIVYPQGTTVEDIEDLVLQGFNN
ncbi:MAG: hypothetical protein ABJC04_00475, partial [Verrucomicrobiota bacterium]